MRLPDFCRNSKFSKGYQYAEPHAITKAIEVRGGRH